MRYSNIDWVDNFSIQNTPKFETLKRWNTIQENLTNNLFDFYKKLV